MNKILSIIIPTYNMERYLDKCLSSLVVSNANLNLLEVLVINDGSKDSSPLIARKYEGKYPDVYHLIDKENGNYGSCINRGLKEATGKYIKVLDADDYFDTNAFDKYLTLLKDIDVDLVLTNYNVVSEKGTVTKHHSIDLPKDCVKQRKEIEKTSAFKAMQMHSVTYHRRIFSQNNYKQSEGISYTDQEWIFFPMYFVSSVYVSDLTVYQYLVGREGQTMDPKVLIRTISHTIMGTLKMVDDYDKMKFNNEKDNVYFKYRLTKRLQYIYSNFLIKKSNTLSIDDLRKFDEALKSQNQTVYQWGEDISICGIIKFVKRWRHNHNDFFVKLIQKFFHK